MKYLLPFLLLAVGCTEEESTPTYAPYDQVEIEAELDWLFLCEVDGFTDMYTLRECILADDAPTWAYAKFPNV